MTKAGIATLITLAGNYKNIFQLNLTAGIEGMWNGTSQVQDTVRVYLRNSSSPYAIVDNAKIILNTAGTGAGTFEIAATGSYYIQLGHRSALETWSSAPVSFTRGSSSNYSFITSASQAFGNNLILKSGRYCTYSGDVNTDGTIDGADGGAVDNAAYNYLNGYSAFDVNGDNYVDASDMSVVDNNSANFVGVIRP
jgi:hypothetical protein